MACKSASREELEVRSLDLLDWTMPAVEHNPDDVENASAGEALFVVQFLPLSRLIVGLCL